MFNREDTINYSTQKPLQKTATGGAYIALNVKGVTYTALAGIHSNKTTINQLEITNQLKT